MFFVPIKYSEPVFRPPAEANAAIIQATIGCSWNKCAFCEMYSSKKFEIKPVDEIQGHITQVARYFKGAKKIFLADGNAFVLPFNYLMTVLAEIKNQFGTVQRVSAYALPSDILRKSDNELAQLRQNGLKLLYIGAETGSDELLQLINKNETFASTSEGILKAQNAGIDTSVMILNGLGGRLFSRQHAIGSARLISAVKPKYLSVLTLSLPFGVTWYQGKFKGKYEPQTLLELAVELKCFLQLLETENTIFRSDHVSNYLVLKGTLSKDNARIMQSLDSAIGKMDKDIYPECSPIL
jgi:radical SAM superfamily enzyme YgiQ (UPF0313 family)